MMKNTKKGFTLIELLVVIAIIGILASVVLASLNTARTKGKDASAIASVSQARAGAELAYDNLSGTYAGICPTIVVGEPTAGATNATEFYNALRNARRAITVAAGSGTNATPGFVTCDSVAGAYAATVHLNADNFCVDSLGFAGKRTTNGLTASQACPVS